MEKEKDKKGHTVIVHPPVDKREQHDSQDESLEQNNDE